MGLISLIEYAKIHNIADNTARERAIRGSFKSTRKIGRNWLIYDNEPLIDYRSLKIQIPDVKIGDIVPLKEIWDGNGEVPEDSYSYLITNNGEDGESNYPIWIDYVFEIIEVNEDVLETKVKIVDIRFL